MHFYLQEAITNVLLLRILTAPHEFAHAWVATLLGDAVRSDLAREYPWPRLER
jgi:hypothetical protein